MCYAYTLFYSQPSLSSVSRLPSSSVLSLCLVPPSLPPLCKNKSLTPPVVTVAVAPARLEGAHIAMLPENTQRLVQGREQRERALRASPH